jgi:dUTP pyrophosphatase
MMRRMENYNTTWKVMGKMLTDCECSTATLPYRIITPPVKRRPYYRLKIFVDSFENNSKMNDIKYKDGQDIIDQENACFKKLHSLRGDTGSYADNPKKNNWQYDFLIALYKDSIQKQAKIMDAYKKGEKVYFDAGFDLFCPHFNDFKYNGNVNVVDHYISCSMEKIKYDSKTSTEISNPVGYYMYPRSSTGTKTPLALTNSVGIIDSGYRGHLMAAFHCVRKPQVTERLSEMPYGWTNDLFQRLVQICPPDLSYPTEIIMVNSLEELGVTERGSGGFGSTGI